MPASWNDVASVNGGKAYTAATWHSEYSILAASTLDSVEFFNAEGERREKVLQKGDNVACGGLLAWHPTKKLLATNWSNGTLIIWNEAEQTSREAIGHDSPVKVLTWSPNGHRLVSADAVHEYLFFLTLRTEKCLFGDATYGEG